MKGDQYVCDNKMTFTKYTRTDIKGHDYDWYKDSSLTDLVRICENRDCVSFNDRGWVKYSTDPRAPIAEDISLYVLNDINKKKKRNH